MQQSSYSYTNNSKITSNMVGTNKSLPTNEGTYLRKIRKPLIEKKRRERMNQSITQLRALIDDTVKQNVAPMTRVDKADILELTVCHLTKLRNQKPFTMVSDSRTSYAAGFQDCAQQVTSFLIDNGLIDSRRLLELNQHLQISATRRPNDPIQTSYYTSTPARVQPSTHQLAVPQTHLLNVSPIHSYDVDKQFVSPFKYISRNQSTDNSIEASSSGSSFSSSLSPAPSSLSSPGNVEISSASHSKLSTCSLTSANQESEVHGGTVSIGIGSENKIGHVIQERTWRPW